MQNKIPKLTVCIVTYNQEKYVEQCLESILSQITNFEFEVIVADDCSSDRTRDIINAFYSKYPDVIIPVLHEKNIGALANFEYVHQLAKGEYIAHMDGDDYALAGKLQTQVDYLDNNKDINLVWTPVYVLDSDGVLFEQNDTFKELVLKKTFSRKELIRYGTLGANSSLMYRNLGAAIPVVDFGKIDYFYNVIKISDGLASFSGISPLTVYRSGIGIASSGLTTRLLTLKSIEYFLKNYPEYRLDCNIAALTLLLSDIKNRNGTIYFSLKLFLKSFHIKSLSSFLRDFRLIKSLNYNC